MSASTGTQFHALGRIVWGHPAKLVQRTDTNKKPILKDDGSPAMQTVFGLAIPKAEFLAQIWPLMQQEAAKGYPNGVPNSFSWKLDDGDGVDSNGKPFAEREGYTGHYILTIASNTGFAPHIYKWNGTGYDQLPIEAVKCGDYVNVLVRAQVNIPKERTHTPSLYINPDAIEFVGYGKEIISAGVNPMTAFGGRQHALPPGASAAPLSSAPAGVGMPGAPQMQPQNMPGAPMAPQQQYAPQPGPAPMQMPAGYPAPQPMQPQYAQPGPAPMAPQGMPGQMPGAPMAPQQQPQYAPQPAHDFVQGAPQQQPQYAQPGAPMAPQQQYAQPGMPGQMPPR